MEISMLAAAGLVVTFLVHRRAVQINRRHDLPGPERGCATAGPPRTCGCPPARASNTARTVTR